MHVLMTADALGGVFTHATQLGAFLSSRGARITLATMGAGLDTWQQEICVRSGITVEQSSWRLEWMRDPWHDVARAGDWLLELERRYRPDVVHLNGYCHAALPWRTEPHVVAHSCVCSWWRAVRGEAAPAEYDRYRREVGAGLSAARTVVAPTAAMLRSLTEEYGPLPRSVVIHNGVAEAGALSLRKEPIVLGAGRLWDPAKNMSLLDAAAREVPWPCCVAGPERGPDGQAAVAFERLVPLGLLSQNELARWFARASIFAAPALYEPFGLAILEAANAGCALVLADIPSLRELWSEAAVFADPHDANALSAAVRRLIADPAERTRLAAHARRKAQQFRIERMGARYLELYNSGIKPERAALRMEAQT